MITVPLIESLGKHKYHRWRFWFLTAIWHLESSIVTLLLALFAAAGVEHEMEEAGGGRQGHLRSGTVSSSTI